MVNRFLSTNQSPKNGNTTWIQIATLIAETKGNETYSSVKKIVDSLKEIRFPNRGALGVVGF